MKIAPYLTADEFVRDPQNVEALNSFLGSEPGQNLLSVLFGTRPTRLALRSGDGAMSTEKAEYLLGRTEGFEFALELLTQSLTSKVKGPLRSSSKAGGSRSEITPTRPPAP